MSLEVFGGGDEEDLVDLATKYNYELCSDGKWRENMSEKGLTDEQMWQHVWQRLASDLEDFLDLDA